MWVIAIPRWSRSSQFLYCYFGDTASNTGVIFPGCLRVARLRISSGPFGQDWRIIDEADMKQIVSRDNPGFKSLRVLAENAREPRRQGQALLEGVHLLQAYRDKVGLPKRLVVSERGLKQVEIQALLATLAGVDVWCLGESLFGQLSEMTTPVGILALIDIPDSSCAPAAMATTVMPTSPEEKAASCVLLDGVQDAGNVGSILRTAAAAGIREVFLGSGCAAAWSPRVLRAGQGAHFDLLIHEQADLHGVLQNFRGTSIAASAHGEAALYALDLLGPLAWLFGSEGRGIHPRLEASTQRRVTIPLMPGCESLNVAAAAAICLFEEVRQKLPADPHPER